MAIVETRTHLSRRTLMRRSRHDLVTLILELSDVVAAERRRTAGQIATYLEAHGIKQRALSNKPGAGDAAAYGYAAAVVNAMAGNIRAELHETDEPKEPDDDA